MTRILSEGLEKTLIFPHATILDAMTLIDESAFQIALVVDHDNKLLGTITDGDVRRGIIRGIPLDGGVENIVNTSDCLRARQE